MKYDFEARAQELHEAWALVYRLNNPRAVVRTWDESSRDVQDYWRGAAVAESGLAFPSAETELEI